MNSKESIQKFRKRMIGFKSELDREIETTIMRSDRLRSAILGSIFISLAVILSGLTFFFPAAMKFVLGDRFIPYIQIPVIFLFGLYEFGYRFLIGFFADKGLKFPIPPRYGNAFIELTFPTLVLYTISLNYSPSIALSTPVLMAYLLIIMISALRLDPVLSFVSGLFGAFQYLLLSGFLGLLTFKLSYTTPLEVPYIHFSRAFFIIIAGVVVSFIAYQINGRLIKLIKSREEKNKIASIFGQHVSPAVMEKLLAQKTEMVSEMRHVCVMFLDIRNFTSFSQKKEPEYVVEYLNQLFDFMIDIVNDNHGVINKFLGDGFMAVFGAPVTGGEDVRNAVRASIQILSRLEIEVASERIIPTRIGIGLHSGDAITGNVGSKIRREYTVIGDVVNLASRIEQLNKQFKSSILVSDSVIKSAGIDMPELKEAKSLGPVAVKGRDQEVEIFQVV